jgi:GNAT superfamily N-acetyltransferase
MSSPIEIEVANSRTVECALPLLRAQLEEHHIAIDPSALEGALRGLVEVEGRGRVLLARQDGSVVAVAVLAHTWTLERGGMCTWLDELYVRPELRSQGIGKMLLDQAIGIAQRDGCNAIELEVEADHSRAEGLYIREGFQRLSRRRFTKQL